MFMIGYFEQRSRNFFKWWNEDNMNERDSSIARQMRKINSVEKSVMVC